ncbi:MAG: tetratricopeptide repeat protein, partial [Acidobacteria bacterium]|nr:tetratricopeptide repeat protein [Acidobacteriota bacterium]
MTHISRPGIRNAGGTSEPDRHRRIRDDPPSPWPPKRNRIGSGSSLRNLGDTASDRDSGGVGRRRFARPPESASFAIARPVRRDATDPLRDLRQATGTAWRLRRGDAGPILPRLQRRESQRRPDLLINYSRFPQTRRPPLSETFDVFFSYNSQDREAVRRVANEMRRQGLRVWMDEEDLPLGQPWQPHVEDALKVVRSAAILLGPSGFGDWQKEEARLCLNEGVKREIPIISVLLPGGPNPEELPGFLSQRTCSDLRNDHGGDRLQRLIREIRGSASEPPTPRTEVTGPVRPPRGPKIHNLPFLPLRDLLKGRDEELRTLETNLQGSTAATAITQTQAIHGLGGIGKTRLAVEYAWRSGDRYEAVLFVVADSPEALRSGLAKLAELDLPSLSHSPSRAQKEEVAAILAWLREHDRWLLILDNVDTPEAAAAVEDLLPRLAHGHVVVTSRRREWSAGIQEQSLGILSREEAVQFLLQRTDRKRASSPTDPDQAKGLADILGSLPLALEQAAAYIVHHQISFKRYLEDWEIQRSAVLSYYDKNVMRYPASVAVTWQTTFNQLHPTAAALLRLTAYLAPDPIPLDMFEKGASRIEEAVGFLLKETGQEASPQTVREGLAELAAYSMIIRGGGTGTVHRMVQEVIRGRIPEERRREWIERTLRLVDDYAPFEVYDVRTWPVWNLLRPHAALAVDVADKAGIATPTARLLAMLSLLYKTRGLFLEAEPLVRRALELNEKTYGSNHSEVAVCLNNLAQLLKATNRLAEAEPLMRRALKIDEDSFGQDHPNVAIDLNNLAALLKATNRLAEAEPLMRRVVEIFEKNLGPDHPNVATSLNNLAQLLQATNRLAEAEPLMRRVLKIDEDSFGPDHPEIATDLNNLAQLLKATNRLAEAEPLMRRALKIDEDSFGQDHPNVAIRLSNLASLLQDTNRLSEAEPLMRRALKIDEDSFGQDHPKVATRLINLGSLFQATSRSSEAEPLIRRALKIDEDSY